MSRHGKPLVYACFWLLVGTSGLAQQGASPGDAGAAPPCVSCQILSVTPGQVAALPARLNGARIVVRSDSAGDTLAAVNEIRRLGGRPGVHFAAIPDPNDPRVAADVDTWLFEGGRADLDRAAYDLKQALAAARGHAPGATLLLAASGDRAAGLRDRGLDAYVTAFVPPPVPIERAEDLLEARRESVLVRMLPRDAPSASGIAAAAAALQTWFPEGLVPVRDRTLTCGAEVRIPAFLNPSTLDLVAATTACPPAAVLASDVPGAAVERYDLGSVAAFVVHAGTSDRFAEGVNVAGTRTLTVEEIVVRHQAAAARQAAAVHSDIATGTFTLTFEAPSFVAPVTIVARTEIFRTSNPEPELELPNPEPRAPRPAPRAPRDLTEVRQSDIRVNGVLFTSNGGVPNLPILEPERAAAPPLTITLSELYRYRLAGRETLRGRDTYVVAFEPKAGAASLFDGRAWIDAATFGMVRVAATQTGLKGAIVASEQTDDFSRDADGHWLLARSDVRQTYEGASVKTPIHRLLILEAHDINAPDFHARLAAAHASPDVMLRETADGFRYLKREVRGTKYEVRGTEVEPVIRTLAGKSDRIRTFAFGVIVDPNISIPLPFAGLSYVDFNLFGTGTQFSGFYGGSYGQLAFSAPSVRGTRWQIAGRAFGIASSYNDRAFDEGIEQYNRGIRQRPAQVAVWTLRPLSARTALRLEYDWDYNRYARADVTAPEFRVPRNQNAHAIKIGLDAQRAGWQASTWVSHAHRIGWHEWGVPGDADRALHSDYQRFGASLLRSGAISPSVTTRIEGAVMGGRHLDRFSRYTFGTFDNRLHGYPSALVRYDHGGVLRTAAAWTVGAVRLDGFGDAALVHDPAFGPGLRHYAGAGAAIEAPGPFRTLLSLEWGYGFQGIDTAGRKGTHVFRLSGYKVF